MALSEEQKRRIEEEERYRKEIRGKLTPQLERKSKKSRVTAAILAIFLGGIGIHKFYLGKAGWGITYLIFSWTGVPLVLGIFEGIYYLFMSNQSFEAKYS